jgi:hypothetical protein
MVTRRQTALRSGGLAAERAWPDDASKFAFAGAAGALEPFDDKAFDGRSLADKRISGIAGTLI